MHHIVVGIYLVQFSQDWVALPNPLVDVLDHPVLDFLTGSHIALLEQPANFGQSQQVQQFGGEHFANYNLFRVVQIPHLLGWHPVDQIAHNLVIH